MPERETSQLGETSDRDNQTADYQSANAPSLDTNNPAAETNSPVPPGEKSGSHADSNSHSRPVTLGRYELLSELGQGGFGTVYVANDPMLGRQVAIKVPRRSRSGKELDDLLKEARRLAQLRHPGIVAVHDVGVADGVCYIVTEKLEGQSLAAAIRRRRFTWQEAVDLVAAVADALAHAHALSVVHRDVKPGNIFLTSDGRPVLLDFGLAVTDVEVMKDPGFVAGTPSYMAPEQAQGQAHRGDGRTDVYSLGVVLYQLVCGRVPFRSENSIEQLRKIVEDDPQPPRQLAPHLPPALEQICLKAMAKKVGDRFTTAGDFAQALRSMRSDPGAAINALLPPQPVVVPPPVVAAEPSSARSLTAPGPGSSTRRREAERRQVTVAVFAAESGDADPEKQLDLTRTVRGWVNAAVAAFGGTVLSGSGQEHAACFGFPIAHEDAAVRAVRAALDVLKRAGGAAPQVVAVVHSGDAVAEQEETDLGSTVHLAGDVIPVASRIAGQVEAGSVAITDTTAKLVQGYFVTAELPPQRVRGVARPVELTRVERESQVRNRVELVDPENLTPLIGRDTELAVLRDRWEQAGDGSGQVVLLVGDAGLGKSRLIRELREHVTGGPTDAASAVVEWRCAAHHQNSGFHPAIEFFERLLGFDRAADVGERYGRIAAHLDSVKHGVPDGVALLGALLGLPPDPRHPLPALSPQRQKERTVDLLLAWLGAFAGKRPLLFVVEDLHWADPSTLELLTRYVEEFDRQTAFALLTFRPEFHAPWRDSSHHTRIALNRLTRRQIGELMGRKLGRAVPAAVVEQVASRTDGVPLFIEEFTKLVQETGMLDRSLAASDSVQLQVIPATLQDLLLARLDRMNCDQGMVQLAAAIGREFDHELLAAAADVPFDQLQAETDKLVAAEVLFRKGRPPNCAYIFKHALIQDAAYNSMLRAKRQATHRRIAEALERDFPDARTGRPEVLARHWTEAGNAEPAIDYWLAAGRRAQARFANAEAVEHLRSGLALLATLPEGAARDARELQFQLPLSMTLMMARGYAHPDLEAVHARARALCERLGPSAPLFHVIWGNWALRLLRDELDETARLAAELCALADERNDDGMRVEGLFAVAITCLYRGEFQRCRDACARCRALEDPAAALAHSAATGQHVGMAYRCYEALSSWYLGFPDAAAAQMREAVAFSRGINQPFSIAYALHHADWLACLLRDADACMRHATECVALSAEQGFPFWAAVARVGQGTAHMIAGRLEPALAAVTEGLAMFTPTGSRKSLSEYYGYLAEIHVLAGRPAEARAAVAEALAFCEVSNNRGHEADLHRLNGEAALLDSPPDAAAAEEQFRRSLDVARRQGALSWELRTATSLARLWNRTGRGAQARDLLADVYGRFTEGFSTPDLIDARKLLDELTSTVPT